MTVKKTVKRPIQLSEELRNSLLVLPVTVTVEFKYCNIQTRTLELDINSGYLGLCYVKVRSMYNVCKYRNLKANECSYIIYLY